MLNLDKPNVNKNSNDLILSHLNHWQTKALLTYYLFASYPQNERLDQFFVIMYWNKTFKCRSQLAKNPLLFFFVLAMF
jgi:hypothetical protein